MAKLCFDKLRNFFAKDSMAVAHRKEVSAPILPEMWQHKVGILVDFVRVLRAEPGLGREREFGDTVVKLLRCVAVGARGSA